MKTSVPLVARFSVPDLQFFLLIAKQLLPVLQFLKELQITSLEARLFLLLLCSCRSGVCGISAVSGKDVPSATFVEDESLHVTSLNLVTECIISLNSDAKLFVTVVAVKRGVGRLRGELRFHAKILGTAPGLGLILPLRLFFKSSGLKCLEQTLVPSNIEKNPCLHLF